MNTKEKLLVTLSVEEFSSLLKNLIIIKNEDSLPKIFGIEKLSEVTGYTVSTLYKKTSKKEIPHFRLGRKVLFSRDEVYEFILKNKQESVSEFCEREQSIINMNIITKKGI
jgi:excisionase family DNA binding protein